MKLITGTGLVLLVAFAVGVFGGIGWLMISALFATLVWSFVSDRTTRWTAPKGWYRHY